MGRGTVLMLFDRELSSESGWGDDMLSTLAETPEGGRARGGRSGT